jgi:DNA ligase 1
MLGFVAAHLRAQRHRESIRMSEPSLICSEPCMRLDEVSSTRRRLLAGLLVAASPWSGAFAAVGQALPLVLPSTWSDTDDPAAYLVSEKFDGVRGYWDGSKLRFKSGRAVPAPAWFTARLPPESLDGELWLGRGRFDELSGIVRTDPPVDADWRKVQYMVFELPESVGRSSGTFADRARQIERIATRTGWSQLVAVEQTPATNREALRTRLAQIVANRGEGLVLHRASAVFSTGRSDVLMKLKPCLDAEATVIAYREGKGKYQGRVGALEMQTPQGRRFLLGSGLSDALRSDPPPLGSSVTYRYRDLTSTGLPRFATYLRIHESH